MHATDPGRRATPPASRSDRLVAVVVLALAALWLATSLVAIANYGLRYPAFDQFRLYVDYLSRDFPDSVLQLENGHRPILPALLRVAEVHLFGANQRLQLLVGALLALLGAAVPARAAWHDRASAAAGAAGVLLAVLGVFWLGNARMLMHGNELVHTYLVVACAGLVAWGLHAGRERRPGAAMAVAGGLALAATFSFGPGMAVFAALFLLAAALRYPWRSAIAPALMFVAAVALYLAELPGDGGVRDSLALRPLDNLSVQLRWLAAPWFHAWLGYADPAVLGMVAGDDGIDHALGVSARALAAALGEGWVARAGLGLGALGLAAWVALGLRAWRQGRAMSRLGAIAFGLASFGLGTAAIIALGRLEYFDQHPGQVLADRYLPWSCLFWLGLALGALDLRPRRAARLAAWSAPALALAAMVVLQPSQVTRAGWSAAVHRAIQHASVAAQLGLWDAERMPRHDDASRDAVERTLALMRERGLSMFGEPTYALHRQGWRAPPGDAAVPAGSLARVVRTLAPEPGQPPAVAIEGWFGDIPGRPRELLLVVVDEAGAPRGLARLSFIGPHKRGLRLDLPPRRGFDGYVLEPAPGERLRVLALHPGTRAVLAQVPVEG